MSYRKLSSLTGVNYNVISSVCNDKMVKAETFLKICEFFNYSKKEILDIYEEGLKEYLILQTIKDKKSKERFERFEKGKGDINGRA